MVMLLTNPLHLCNGYNCLWQAHYCLNLNPFLRDNISCLDQQLRGSLVRYLTEYVMVMLCKTNAFHNAHFIWLVKDHQSILDLCQLHMSMDIDCYYKASAHFNLHLHNIAVVILVYINQIRFPNVQPYTCYKVGSL